MVSQIYNVNEILMYGRFVVSSRNIFQNYYE